MNVRRNSRVAVLWIALAILVGIVFFVVHRIPESRREMRLYALREFNLRAAPSWLNDCTGLTSARNDIGDTLFVADCADGPQIGFSLRVNRTLVLRPIEITQSAFRVPIGVGVHHHLWEGGLFEYRTTGLRDLPGQLTFHADGSVSSVDSTDGASWFAVDFVGCREFQFSLDGSRLLSAFVFNTQRSGRLTISPRNGRLVAVIDFDS